MTHILHATLPVTRFNFPKGLSSSFQAVLGKKKKFMVPMLVDGYTNWVNDDDDQEGDALTLYKLSYSESLV